MVKKDQSRMADWGADMKVVIYCRVGSPSQLASEGLDKQEEQLKEYCREHGYEVANIFKEQISGNSQPGSELEKVMKMILKKEVEGVVVMDLSRISRDTSNFFSFEKFLRESGAKLIDQQFGVMDYARYKLRYKLSGWINIFQVIIQTGRR